MTLNRVFVDDVFLSDGELWRLVKMANVTFLRDLNFFPIFES